MLPLHRRGKRIEMDGAEGYSGIEFELEKNEELKAYRVKQVMNIKAQILTFKINPGKIKELYAQMIEAEEEGFKPIEEMKRYC